MVQTEAEMTAMTTVKEKKQTPDEPLAEGSSGVRLVSLRRTLDEPLWGIVIPFRIDRPAAKLRSEKSLEVRRLERLDRARLILDMMQRDGLGFREVGAKFGISGPMAFKLVKEFRASGERLPHKILMIAR